ncbi:hypothetical protein STENM327S_02196 [Streptomyces tendae]
MTRPSPATHTELDQLLTGLVERVADVNQAWSVLSRTDWSSASPPGSCGTTPSGWRRPRRA